MNDRPVSSIVQMTVFYYDYAGVYNIYISLIGNIHIC